AQNLAPGSVMAVPQLAHSPGRYRPQLEQYSESGSGRGPHSAQASPLSRICLTSASARSSLPAPATEAAPDATSVAADARAAAASLARMFASARSVYRAFSAS